MLSSSQDVKLATTTSPHKLLPSDCITLYNTRLWIRTQSKPPGSRFEYFTNS